MPVSVATSLQVGAAGPEAFGRAQNVATLVSAPRISKDKMRTLSPDEVRRLLEGLDNFRLRALYVLRHDRDAPRRTPGPPLGQGRPPGPASLAARHARSLR